MTADTAGRRAAPDFDALEEIQRRVLWLAVRIVDAANHERDTGDGVKVGGHQASSASMVTVMTGRCAKASERRPRRRYRARCAPPSPTGRRS